MTTTPATAPPLVAARGRTSRAGGLRLGLGGRPALSHIGPNWFAPVMGTGIVANAAVTLPVRAPVLLDAARLVWVLDAGLLAAVLSVTALHWLRHPAAARGHLADPVMSWFYGAPAMALMTVGAGALLLGEPLVGSRAAILLAVLLWSAGTGLGLWTAVAVPLRAFTEHETGPAAASGSWLMPVVPPMVSAATGALLVPHLPAGQPRATMLYACYAMFGLTLLASLITTTLIWNRLVQHRVGAAAAVPTLWIVLGPLGQSVTAAHTLGEQAAHHLPAPYATAFHALGLVYGVPVWGFALLWLALVGAITVRTARQGLPFTLGWWSFTFPVGTVVTATSGLAAATGGLPLFTVAATLGYVGLVLAWVVVAARTVRGICSGRLLLPPEPARTTVDSSLSKSEDDSTLSEEER